MANVLSKSNIANSNIIEAWQVSQSVDAFTGIVDYDVTISGSLTVTGSQKISGSISSSNGANTIGFHGTSSWAVSASSTVSASYALSASYVLSSSYALSSSTSISSSYALSASYALNSVTASYINPASVIPLKFAPSYLLVSNATYPPSTPYSILGASPTNLYISASSVVGLQFTSTNVTDGQIINFNPFWQFPDITTALIAITASVNVYGINGGTSLVSPGTPKTLDQIGVAPTIKSFTFQYINTPGITFPAAGWYLININ